jgi:two-component system invasion response regulator UvrY
MEKQPKPVKIAMADDHLLFRAAIGGLLSGYDNYQIILEAADGKELLEKLKPDNLPDILLLDLSMPGMGGMDTAALLFDKYPQIHIMMLTMYENDQSLIRLLQFGVKGFLKKDIHPAELNLAIKTVMKSGFYYSQQVSGKMANLFRQCNGNLLAMERAMLTAQEITFLKMAATELTYKEIAAELKMNPRTIDSIRDHLFEKLEVKSRVGLAMYAIRHGVVAL